MSTHTISLLVENRHGALSRIANLFSGRGYNISSLTVAETEDPTVSRMTIVVTGEEGLQKRWSDTPVLLIQRIVVLETTASPKVYYPTPRQRH